MKFIFKKNNRIASGLILMGLGMCASGFAKDTGDVRWFNGEEAVTYSLSPKVDPVVETALSMWKEDMQEVTGKEPRPIKSSKGTNVRIVQLDKEKITSKTCLEWGISLDSLKRYKEAFYLTAVNHQKEAAAPQIVIVGSDARGTAYGILELSRLAGVSPWIWWGEVKPQKQTCLTLPAGFRTFQHPSVEYRGIFLNDEDWSLQPWAWQTFDKQDKPGTITARTYKEIFKLLLRLRGNTIWPGMHGCTTAFYKVPGAKETADSCGIVIGTSHCEPLMRNNVGEWNEKERGRFNYITNRPSVQSYWIERLKEVKDYENFYTIGMRGIHDGSMEGVKTLQEKTDALQQVIDDQRKLLATYVNKRVEQLPQSFVPYKEVLQIYENGLQVPEDITLIWCDDNYGYMTRLSDSLQQQRSGGAGVYYHLSYWGRPHDYLWLTTTQPGLLYNEMKEAYNHHARKLWIVNVHDLKPAAYDLELFMDMAWNIRSVEPQTLKEHLAQWLCTNYGEAVGRKLLPAMQEFYRLCGIRKPEFMGWNQVELDKKKFARGMSPVVDSEFSLTEFGGELDRYLNDYRSVARVVMEAKAMVEPRLQESFFMQIEYPVMGAVCMAQKMLEAQRARALAGGTYDEARWQRDEQLFTACSKSMKAYFDIRQRTEQYNKEVAGGKWNQSMCDHPRDLYVFNPPLLPVALTEAEMRKYVERAEVPFRRLEELNQSPSHAGRFVSKDCVAANACTFDKASSAKVVPVQMLGHSMNAVSLPKGESISFDFNCLSEGEAQLCVALIPTQPNDKGDIRYAVSLDGKKLATFSIKEPFRSENWKLNVLRGQARNSADCVLAKGKHTLTLTALDNHILVDQWMLDFEKDRKHYLFPLAGSYPSIMDH